MPGDIEKLREAEGVKRLLSRYAFDPGCNGVDRFVAHRE